MKCCLEGQALLGILIYFVRCRAGKTYLNIQNALPQPCWWCCVFRVVVVFFALLFIIIKCWVAVVIVGATKTPMWCLSDTRPSSDDLFLSPHHRPRVMSRQRDRLCGYTCTFLVCIPECSRPPNVRLRLAADGTQNVVPARCFSYAGIEVTMRRSLTFGGQLHSGIHTKEVHM